MGVDELSLDARYVIAGTRLETRAWALQERVFARAIIHFTSTQLLWECCAGIATKEDPTIDMAEHSMETYGYSVHEMERMLYDQFDTQDVNLWYGLAEEFV